MEVDDDTAVSKAVVLRSIRLFLCHSEEFGFHPLDGGEILKAFN